MPAFGGAGVTGLFNQLAVNNEDFASSFFGIDIPGNLSGVASGERYNYTPGQDSDIQQLETISANELSRTRSGAQNQVADSLVGIANREGIEKQAAEARGLAGQASDVARGEFDRRTRGLALTDRQKMGANQQLSLNRAVSQADAGTNARRGMNRDALAASRAGGAFDDIAFSQQMAGLTGLANAEGQRRIREAQEAANKQSSKNAMLGTVIGIGASILSSEDVKDKVEVSPRLLDKLKDMRIDKWKYHGGDRDHIGPYAEEFNEKFGVGKMNDRIDLVSLLGVTLGSIKELNAKVESLG